MVRIVLASLFAAALGLMWATQAPPAPPLKIEKVRDNLYVIPGGNAGNIGVLVTTEGVMLVDDKFDRHVREILDLVKSVTPQPVRYVLNTHHHGDHSGGNETLISQTEILMHSNARENMVRNNQPGVPRIAFADTASLHLGGAAMEIRHFGRGHTNGDVFAYYPALRVVHTGDMFVEGDPYVDYANGGSIVEWDRTLEQVLQWDFDLVIPGHGPVQQRKDLVEWIEKVRTVRSRLRELSLSGKSPDDAKAQLKLEDFPGWGPRLHRALPGMLGELGRQ